MTVADPGAIVPVAEMFTALSKGVYDVWMDAYPGYYSGVFPEALIHSGLPFAWERQTHVWDAFYNYGLLDEFRKLYSANNVYLASANGPGAENGFLSTFPFASVNDWKGKKICTGGAEAEFVKSIGATPVLIPYAERYMALKTGTVDAIISGVSMLEDMKLKEMVRYVAVEPNWNCFGCGQLINMDVWKKLPVDIQKIIENETPHVLVTLWSDPDFILGRQVLGKVAKEYPIKIVSLSSEDKKYMMQQAMTTVYDIYASKSATSAKIVNIIRKQMKDLGKMD
jgi:TRAP-type C4-dicarboxylate transport system substrate-binding protein